MLFVFSVSRALGDWSMKAARRGVLIAEPEVSSFDLEPFTSMFLILATDGVWDVCSNEEAVQVVAEVLNRYERMEVEREEGNKEELSLNSNYDFGSASKENHNSVIGEPSRSGAGGVGGSYAVEATRSLLAEEAKASEDNKGLSTTKGLRPDDNNKPSFQLKGSYTYRKIWTSPCAVRLAAKALVDYCLEKGTEDNVTVTIVRFCWHQQPGVNEVKTCCPPPPSAAGGFK